VVQTRIDGVDEVKVILDGAKVPIKMRGCGANKNDELLGVDVCRIARVFELQTRNNGVNKIKAMLRNFFMERKF